MTQEEERKCVLQIMSDYTPGLRNNFKEFSDSFLETFEEIRGQRYYKTTAKYWNYRHKYIETELDDRAFGK